MLWLYRQLTEEDKDELLHEPLACYPVPFPRDSLLLADAGEPAGAAYATADVSAAMLKFALHICTMQSLTLVLSAQCSSCTRLTAACIYLASSSCTVNQVKILCCVPLIAAQHASGSSKMAETVNAWWQAWASAPVQDTSSSSNNGGSNNHSGENSPSSSTSSSNAPRRRLRSNSKEPGAAAPQLLAADFRMLDAYGLWPNMRANGRRYLNKDACIRFMQSLSYSFNIELTVLDVAVAEGSLACFSHWQARLVPRWQGQGSGTGSSAESLETPEAGNTASAPSSSASESAQAVQQQEAGSSTQQSEPTQQAQNDGSMLVDGVAVDLFNEDMQLKVIWVFRGPVTAQEKQLFLEYDKQLAEAEAAQAESEQEAIRAARRAQREQQVCLDCEGLCWLHTGVSCRKSCTHSW